jgi:serine/threonine protein kinase
MERLTFSPYVLNIYGYCGQSAINELANFGIEGLASLEKIARQFRGVNVEPVNKIKLQLASMVAAGVSHMHSIDYPDHIPSNETNQLGPPRKSNATLVHYDLNPRNVAIVKRGKPKLNDFNVAEFLSWDTKSNATCGFSGRFREPWWRAPEEMRFHDSSYKHPAPLTEKVDIYSLGNILHTILTTHSPRGKMTKELMKEIRPKVARGELPKLPSDFNETEAAADPALLPIMNAMYKCLRALPEDRPSAGEIAEELALAVDNLPEEYGDKEKFYHSQERERMKEQLKKNKKRKSHK